MCHKKNIKSKNYKNCLGKSQLENKISHLKIYSIDINNRKSNHKEVTENNKFILKTKQRFKIEKHNVFIEEIIKIKK